MNDPISTSRRPLKVRQASFAKNIARWLSNKNITPNQISVGSIGFAALSSVCLVLIPHVGLSAWYLPIAAALFIQCRLLCNLFDGMVAIEGAKGTRAGELYNDIPDRIADPMILVALGYSIIDYHWSINLGWAAGLLAVMTAYVRTLSASIDAPISFQGPMAKQHRMAIVTAACVVGCVITVINRTRTAYQFLETNSLVNE